MLRNKTLYFCLTNQLIDRKFIFESVPIVKLPKWKFDISETRSIVYSKGLSTLQCARWTSRQIWKANDNLWLVWSYTKTSLNRTEKRWVHFKQRSDKSSNSESSVFFFIFQRQEKNFIYRLDKVKRISKSFNFCPWFFGRYEI